MFVCTLLCVHSFLSYHSTYTCTRTVTVSCNHSVMPDVLVATQLLVIAIAIYSDRFMSHCKNYHGDMVYTKLVILLCMGIGACQYTPLDSNSHDHNN